MQGKLSRRKFAAGIGSIGAAGIGVHTLTGTSQAAEVSIDGLSIPDKDKLVREPISDIRISCDVQWSYNGNVVPQKVEIALMVGTHPDELNTISLWENTDLALESDSGTETLQASLFNSPDFDLEQFQTSSSGESKSSNVLTAVEMRVVANDRMQSTDYAEAVHTIGVENGTIEMTNQVGGTGNVSIQTEG